jgi:DNA-binding PadR family transcriptional regulator
VSEKGRRAKYYSVTARGRAALATTSGEWSRYVKAVEKVVAREVPA